MDKLTEIRNSIDKIDEQIVKLFESRMQLVKQVADYKKENKSEVYQGARENQVLERAVENLEDKNLAVYAQSLMKSMMALSKDYQRSQINTVKTEIEKKPLDLNARVGYFGVEGSNTEKATVDFFGDGKFESFSHMGSIFEAIDSGEICYGVIPIENSSTGAINDVYDLMDTHNCYIVGEIWERIDHNLWGIQGSELSDIKEIYSHPQAFEQSKEFLDNYSWERIPYYNTAIASKMVKESNDKTKGAISSKRAGQLYGLKLLKDNIQTQKENFTRFIIVSKTLIEGKSDKISLEFSLEHQPGALRNVLEYFARYGVNMSSICSRPIKNYPGKYNFYIDFEKSGNDEEIKMLFEGLSGVCERYKMLGEYKKGGFYE